jgi:hypothetical protein
VQVANQFLDFSIARSHLKLNSRENKILDLFFQLHGFFLSHSKRSKVLLGQAAKITGLGISQLSQGFDDLIMKNVVLRVKAQEVVTEREGEKLHSLPALESMTGFPVYGVVYDSSIELFFCLNYSWETWLYAKDVPILAVMRKFEVVNGKPKVGEFASVGPLAKKALDYFCTKFVSKYRTKYSVNAGSMKEFMNLIEQLRLRVDDDQAIFSLIDCAYERRLDMVHPMLIKYVTEDLDLFLSRRPRQVSERGSFFTDPDGRVRVR